MLDFDPDIGAPFSKAVLDVGELGDLSHPFGVVAKRPYFAVLIEFAVSAPNQLRRQVCNFVAIVVVESRVRAFRELVIVIAKIVVMSITFPQCVMLPSLEGSGRIKVAFEADKISHSMERH